MQDFAIDVVDQKNNPLKILLRANSIKQVETIVATEKEFSLVGVRVASEEDFEYARAIDLKLSYIIN